MIFQALFQRVLAKAGENTGTSSLTVYERFLVHGLYLLPIGWLGWIAASRLLKSTYPSLDLGVGGIVGISVLLASVTFISLLWVAFYRRTSLDQWAVTHFVWLAKSYTHLAAYIAFAALFLVVFMLLALFIHPLALVLIYGLPLITLLVGGIFIFRIFRGYLAFLRQQPINERPRRRRKGPYYDPEYDPELHPEKFQFNKPLDSGESPN